MALKSHWDQLLLKREDVTFLKNVAWMLATVATMSKLVVPTNEKKVQVFAVYRFKKSLLMVFMMKRHDELQHTIFIILNGTAGP